MQSPLIRRGILCPLPHIDYGYRVNSNEQLRDGYRRAREPEIIVRKERLRRLRGEGKKEVRRASGESDSLQIARLYEPRREKEVQRGHP